MLIMWLLTQHMFSIISSIPCLLLLHVFSHSFSGRSPFHGCAQRIILLIHHLAVTLLSRHLRAYSEVMHAHVERN
ncbi:unknown [African cichlid nackednavirus]|nr:unknown [African cichlid nackednavirus]